ncbi:MAG: chromosomal replication initiator protein DnaA [Candidatus Pacebacteria bacterium]|nr:chromosomal replication initiator protein DnaA [Candidatus Paceibacterota bacterium]
MSTDTKKLWGNVLTEIELNVSKATFSTWFKETYILKEGEGIIYVSVPNTFVKEWLHNKYHSMILRSLRNLTESVRSVEYTVSREELKERKDIFEEHKMVVDKLPLNDLYINKEDNLNPRYTFESFVVGPFNELAHAATQAIIKKTGMVYNPLFIYGNTGHGKTHLIQAVGNYLKSTGSGKRIYYVSSEKFVLDLVSSIQSNKTNYFKQKYRKYDVLIMDDIHFLSNKEKTQEELFHLFNYLYDNNKQIIFSSDKHPNYIPHLEDRLKSRFAAGMIVDIPAPDQESRFAILQTKARMNNFSLREEIIDFLASAISSNIRELEGVLNSVIFQTQLKGRELTLFEIKSLVKDSMKPKRNLSTKEVVKVVANFYNIEEDNIYKKTRKKEIIKPRQVIMYILREDFNFSYPSIGEKIGGRDHATIIHSCEKVKNELKTDILLGQEINQIRALIVS